MFKVIAVANGYYGGKIRVPGEVFGIEKEEHFSIEWMETEDGKVLSYVKSQAKVKPDADADKQERDYIKSRAQRFQDWLDAQDEKDDEAEEGSNVQTRRVNTGGTDGVVGVDIPTDGQKLSAKERIAMAQSASGRDDIKTAKEADEVLATLAATGGSSNDDRSRDLAANPNNNAPAPDWEKPAAAED